MKKTSKYNTVSYTPEELKYKMFAKKSCPICGEKMKPFSKKEYIGVGLPGNFGKFAFKEGDVYQYDKYYHCDKH